ncbi:hypothetical protein FQA39_LY00044 [Lamprigera yunnana]|nr:hypothetical protein FQA39_LY00044 [Lamprigera yunnana]
MKRLIAKGENSVESGHVDKMMFDLHLDILKGVVHASMRDRQYKVEIYFTLDWILEKAVCSCPRGQLLCHHMAALALFGHYNVSVTDKTCSWSIPNKVRNNVVQSISQLYPPKQHQSTSRDLTEEEIESFKNKLQIFDGAVGYSWILLKDNSST